MYTVHQQARTDFGLYQLMLSEETAKSKKARGLAINLLLGRGYAPSQNLTQIFLQQHTNLIPAHNEYAL